MTSFHPELATVARLIPRTSISARKVAFIRRVTDLRGTPRVPRRRGVLIEDLEAPGHSGDPAVRVRVYRPAGSTGPLPAILWMHGGGYVIGSAQIDQAANVAIVRELGIVIASVEYRLAPEHPFPAPLDDCVAALRWLHDNAARLGVRPDRIAIGGASAGAGLTASLAQVAHDLGLDVVFQLLVYPMLDDRTVGRAAAGRAGVDGRDLRVWTVASNEFGWTSYLGGPPGADSIPEYAAASRRVDLAGLPPAWMGVGTLDLFHDEDVDYGHRLTAAGVDCELLEVPGAYHGFDVVSPRTDVVRGFRRSYLAALRRALFDAT